MRSCIVHTLPTAATFVGRGREIEQLQSALLDASSTVRTASIIGIGGAGKTALAAEFLRRLPGRSDRPAYLFVWSFYVDQDPGAFLAEAYDFLCGVESDSEGQRADNWTGSRAGALYRLTALLARIDQPVLFVLDGLERVQISRADMRRQFGALEDVLLRSTLTRLTAGVGNARVLITTRFPPADLAPWDRGTHLPVDIAHLDRESARDLLRRRGVGTGDANHNQAMDLLLDEFGTHALTLDHLGGFIARFRGGDPNRPPPKVHSAATADDSTRPYLVDGNSIGSVNRRNRIQQPDVPVVEVVEANLIRVLSAFACELPAVELAMLQRLCLYRFGANADTLFHTFAVHESPELAGALYRIKRTEFDQALHSLVDQHLLSPEGDGTYNTHPAIRDFYYSLFTAPQGFHAAVSRGLGNPAADVAWFEIEGSLKSYGFVSADPHDRADTGRGAVFVEEFRQLIEQHRTVLGEDAYSVLARFINAVAAGDRPEAPRVPRRLISLAGKPGQRHPDDKSTLDLIEELIHHAVNAGHRAAARHLYEQRLGGRDHLGKVLGEFARGERIVAALLATAEQEPAIESDSPRKRTTPLGYTPNQSLMLDRAWYLRGLGDLDHAHRLFMRARPMWAGTVLVLRGLLPEAAWNERFWVQTRQSAQLLMGRREGGYHPIWVGWGEGLVDGDVALLFDKRREAGRLAQQVTGYSAEAARCRLVLAEVDRRDGLFRDAAEHLDAAEPWIHRSGSVEHLILLLSARMLLAESQGLKEAADGFYTEALHLARRCGYGIYHIDLMTHRAAALLDRDVRRHAREARLLATGALLGLLAGDETPASTADLPADHLLAMGALHPRCGYAWGEAAARVVLARCAIVTGEFPGARDQLVKAEAIYARLQAPQVSETRRLRQELRS